jgi:hypothetical protein
MNARLKFGVGAVLELAEADYLYGTGPLAIRLTEVKVDPGQFRAMEWVEVQGIDVYPEGEAAQAHHVTIRVAAIKAALRPPEWRPSHYPPAKLPVRELTNAQQSPDARWPSTGHPPTSCDPFRWDFTGA